MKTQNPRGCNHFITRTVFATALAVLTLTIAATIACRSGEDVVHTVIVEKSVPGKPVIQTVIVDKEVPVAGETVVHTVVVEKSVPGKPVIQTVIVEKEMPVAGETVIQTVVVEREMQVPGETIIQKGLPGRPVPTAAPAATATPAPEYQSQVAAEAEEAVAEKEVIREVEKVVLTEHVVTAAPAATSSSGSHPGVKVPPSSPPGQPSKPGATTFQNTTRSNFVLTSNDDTSTFSLDTDRTSFQLALNWTRAGYDVDPASVRAEEWINAFNYGYELPRHDDSFNITTDVIEHPLENGLHLARVAFQAPELYVDLPLNVTLVLDGSGSMADGSRVEIARAAADAIRRSMGRDDRMSIVHFDDQIKYQLTVKDKGSNDASVSSSIDSLTPGGSTNVQAGLNLGVQLADEMRRRRPSSLNYIILMSDGVANVNATNPFAILESAADRDPDNPLRLITIGVGINNYNDVLLEQLAQHGNGWYRYLSEPHEGRALFSRENWLALSVPFADQTRAQVVWDDESVRSWRMIGYENRVTSDESFTRAEKKFAELPAGVATTVFFELELFDRNVLGRSDKALGEVEVRWVTPRSGDSNRQHKEIESVLSRRDAATDFGAIVALAADRYSGLHEYGGEHPGSIHRDLEDLADMLISVGSPIAGTSAYQDFEYVLNSLVDKVEPPPRTGYSR